MSLSDIQAKPIFIKDIGNVYPITMWDYEDFSEASAPLYISDKFFPPTDIPLLALIFSSTDELGIPIKEMQERFCKVFSLVLKKNVTIKLDSQSNNFIGFCAEGCFINSSNYTLLRETIMKQNLMFEKKIYKNKLVQEWAEKAREAKMRNAPKITMEDIITTVKVFQGLTFDEINSDTIYQLYSEFYRIRNFKDFDKSILFSTVSTEQINITDFAESIAKMLYHEDDLFVNSDKLNKFSGK